MRNTKTSIWGVGGCGTNIVVNQLGQEATIAGNDVTVTCIDTSESNLPPNLPNENVFLFEGVDGSGKHRDENAATIRAGMLRCLMDHPPGEFNIIVSSAGGGSGSVICHFLANELLQRELPVVVILVGVLGHVIEARNTLATLTGLNKLPQLTGLPLAVSYLENRTMGGRHNVNITAMQTIRDLIQLSSSTNYENDRADVKHWLQYNRTLTNVKPAMVGLTIVAGPTTGAPVIQYPQSTASLVRKGTVAKLDYSALYGSEGFVDHFVRGDKIDELHFILSTASLDEPIKQAKKYIADAELLTKTSQSSIDLLETDAGDDDGFVL